MPRTTQAPPPGVVKGASPEATPGRWYDADNVRWQGGVAVPVGGNILLPGSNVSDMPRDVITWRDNADMHWAAFGTDSKLYVYSFDNLTLTDITPAGVGPLQPPGAFAGFGLNTFGTGLFGTTRSSSALPPGIIGDLGDVWSMDTYGEDLLVVPTQDGRLFRWYPTTPTVKAALVTAAPIGNRGVFVTPERFVVLFGSGDPRNVAWSDQENPDVWTPNVTNLAGSLWLKTQSPALCATKTPFGNLIFTTSDVHLMSYVGPPYAYGIVPVGKSCGPISARAVASIGGFVAWPSWQNFWQFGGNVQPLACDVKEWFFATINKAQGGLVFASSNGQFAELWWDWPDQSSLTCNRYLAVNYASPGLPWTIGKRMRTAADPLGSLTYPVLGGADPNNPSGGALFQHEYGWTDNGAARASAGNVYLESGAIVLGEGDKRYNVNQVIMDGMMVDPSNPSFGFEFYSREQPFDSAHEFDTGLYTAVHDGLMDVKFSGRSVRMRVVATADQAWGLGRPRLNIVPAGRR